MSGDSAPLQLMAGVGETIVEIPIPLLDADDDDEDVVITNARAVASYSWLERAEPTIEVPGSPPIWNNQTLPFKVKKDNFTAFVDQNAFRIPEHPLQSLFASVLHLNPQYDFSDLALISDRNNLRKILRWLRGRGLDSQTVKEFRIDVRRVGSTVLFVRKEHKLVEVASRGYGLGFEKMVTDHPDGAREQCGHHRIVRYSLDGIDMLVRFELDACLPLDSDDLNSLISQTNALSISPSHSDTKLPRSQPPGLTIIPSHNRGVVDYSRTVETVSQSRKFRNQFGWSEIYPQLLLSQTRNLFLGLHDFGKFSQLERHTLEELADGDIGEEMQGDLRRLVKALRLILKAVGEQTEREPLVLLCQDGKLSLKRCEDERTPLPDEYMNLF